MAVKQNKPKQSLPVKKTADSTEYFQKKAVYANESITRARNLAINKNPNKSWKEDGDVIVSQKMQAEANTNRLRQGDKGKAGYDANGYFQKPKVKKM